MRRILVVLGGILAAAPSIAAEPIATTDGETPGMSLQVSELKVGDGTVMLKFTILNNGPHAFSPNSLAEQTGENQDRQSVSGVYLIDAANKKKYLAIFDTDSHCICSRNNHDIAPKSSANFWAKFPAPPDGVTKIGVAVPHFIPMDDVPLAR